MARGVAGDNGGGPCAPGDEGGPGSGAEGGGEHGGTHYGEDVGRDENVRNRVAGNIRQHQNNDKVNLSCHEQSRTDLPSSISWVVAGQPQPMLTYLSSNLWYLPSLWYIPSLWYRPSLLYCPSLSRKD